MFHRNLHRGSRIAKINIFGRETCKIQAEHLKRNAPSLLDVFTKRPFTAWMSECDIVGPFTYFSAPQFPEDKVGGRLDSSQRIDRTAAVAAERCAVSTSSPGGESCKTHFLFRLQASAFFLTRQRSACGGGLVQFILKSRHEKYSIFLYALK